MNRTCKDFIKILEHNGYSLNRTKGSHYIFTDGRRTVSVNKDLNRMVARRLLKENALSA